MDEPPEILRKWHGLSIVDGVAAKPDASAHSVAETAFQEAVRRFEITVTERNGKRIILKDAASMQDVQQTVMKSLSQYNKESKFPKANKWLRRLSSRIDHYGKILDVLVQHHPEYVSLAWGAMKLLFVGVLNHEKVVKILAKSLAQLADALPRIELASVLYRTDRMRAAVEELYAILLRFLLRAHDWYRASSLRHMVHSFTHPFELTWSDVLEDISECSQRIDQLATSGSQAELREMHETSRKMHKMSKEMDEKLSRALSKLDAYEQVMFQIKEQGIAFQAINSSALLDTNQRLTDLQLSQIITSLSADLSDKPLKSYQHHLYLRRQRALKARPVVSTNDFWLSPKLREWSTSQGPALAVVKGSYQSRHVLRDFCVDVIEQLRSSRLPVMWALKDHEERRGCAGTESSSSSSSSTAELLKNLTLQALHLNPDLLTEKTMAIRAARFQQAQSGHDWTLLLREVLGGLAQQVYLVVDLDTLGCSGTKPKALGWASALLEMDPTRAPVPPVKVIASATKLATSGTSADDADLPTVVPVRVAGQRKHQSKEMRRAVRSRVGRGRPAK